MLSYKILRKQVLVKKFIINLRVQLCVKSTLYSLNTLYCILVIILLLFPFTETENRVTIKIDILYSYIF